MENNVEGISWIWLLIIMIAIAALIFVFIRSRRSTGSSNLAQKQADLEILRGRYEKGEITREEYQEKRDELTGRKPRHS